MSYCCERPKTARFKDIEWLLHVKDRVHGVLFGGAITPHCLSKSIGPLLRPEVLGFFSFSFLVFCFFSAGCLIPSSRFGDDECLLPRRVESIGSRTVQ